jgi:hypothetical protein
MKIKLTIFSIFFTLFIFACSSYSEELKGCTPPPKEFREADLVGTWVAKHLNLRRDMLVIREDGKYKQIIHLETPAVDYESGWQTWKIEYSEDNLPYLHMEGMRLCAYAPDLINCEQIGGGEENQSSFNAGYWYDFCKQEKVLMPNEGVLIVLGVPEQFVQPPRGIVLRLLMYTESGWAYELEKP